MQQATNKDLLTFVRNNKEKIAKLNPNYTEIVMGSEENEMLFSNYFFHDDFYSAYEEQGYTYDKFEEDWLKHNPEVVLLGEELATVFVTDKKLPVHFANTLSSNDFGFFGSIVNPENAFKEYEVNGKTLYIVWGIPDPGSN